MKKKEDEVLRRNVIRKLLQRNGESIQSLQALFEQETRAREKAAVVRKKKNGVEVEQQLQRRSMEITTFLQRCGTSMKSLQSLCIKKSRQKENCRALPEGNEDEDENEDDDDDQDNDNHTDEEEHEEAEEDNGTVDEDTEEDYDAVQKSTLSFLLKLMASWLDNREDSGSDSNSNAGKENEED